MWGGRCMFVSFNAYRGKFKNLPLNAFLKHCSPLLHISPFTPKFWHILVKNVSETVFESADTLLTGIFSSSTSLFWQKQLLGHITSPTLHITRQEDVVIMGHFQLLVFNQLFWFSVEICIFQWKTDIFHIFLMVKSSGVCQNVFSGWIFQSIPCGKLKPNPVGREKSSFSLG